MTGFLQGGAVCGGTHGCRPTLYYFVGQGPCALPWVRWGIGGGVRASRPTEAFQGVQGRAESPSHGFAVPAPFRQGGRGDGGCGCPCCGAQNFCAALRRTLEILTAATRSPRFFCHWQRSARSPRPVCELVSQCHLFKKCGTASAGGQRRPPLQKCG